VKTREARRLALEEAAIQLEARYELFALPWHEPESTFKPEEREQLDQAFLWVRDSIQAACANYGVKRS
jgi:hypothetical protein